MSKITLFSWTGFNALGQKISGESFGESELDIYEQAKEQEIHIVSLQVKPLSFFNRQRLKPKRKDLSIFIHQLATMLESGVDLLSALKLLAESQSHLGNKILIFNITKQLEEGFSLSESFRYKHPIFNDFFCSLLAVGEQNGQISTALFRISEHQQKIEKLRTKTIKAMIYPCSVMFIAIVLSILMMTVVIPEFKTMFEGFSAPLPWLTATILNLSNWVSNNLLLLMLPPILLSYFLRHLYRTYTPFKLLCAQKMIRTPIIGAVISKASLANFSRTLSICLHSGVPIAQALTSAANTTDNLYYKQAFNRVNEVVAAGASIHIAMTQCSLFPKMMLQMIMIGETSGRLDDILNKVATIYESEVDNIADNLGQLLEPVILVVLGGMIGTLVVSLYLPIFNLVSVF